MSDCSVEGKMQMHEISMVGKTGIWWLFDCCFFSMNTDNTLKYPSLRCRPVCVRMKWLWMDPSKMKTLLSEGHWELVEATVAHLSIRATFWIQKHLGPHHQFIRFSTVQLVLSALCKDENVPYYRKRDRRVGLQLSKESRAEYIINLLPNYIIISKRRVSVAVL